MSPFKAKLTALAAGAVKGRIKPSAKLVAAFEKKFSLTLPDDFRAFLAAHGGTWVSALSPIDEPCPCGQQAVISLFLGFMPPGSMLSSPAWDRPRLYVKPTDIRVETEQCERAPVAIPIASCGFTSLIFLKLTGSDTGHVYYFDDDGRSALPDRFWHRHYQTLDPEMKEWFDKRKKGQLPRKRRGYERFYHMADSFTGFFEHCTHFDIDPKQRCCKRLKRVNP